MNLNTIKSLTKEEAGQLEDLLCHPGFIWFQEKIFSEFEQKKNKLIVCKKDEFDSLQGQTKALKKVCDFIRITLDVNKHSS